MSILIDKNTRVVTQGITGKTGQFHTRMCRDYANGKNCFVAGVNPKKAGEDFEGIPIYASVRDAKREQGVTASVIYVPPPGAAAAIWEAVEADLDLVICITEGIPVRDMIEVRDRMRKENRRTVLVGPNCPGVITPEEIKIGIMPGHIHRKGRIGVVSRSGTLTYEAVWQTSQRGIGQSTCVGIGGDPVRGFGFIEALELFNADKETDGVVMIGEIGGTDEVEAAKWIKAHMKKPVAGFIAGRTAPKGKRMGHAGAIIGGDPVNGMKHIDVMRLFNDDPETDAVIMVGEIGGSDEEECARWIKANMKKPVAGFIAGRTAPKGKRMGHAGAIIGGAEDTAQAKIEALKACGIAVAESPADLGSTMMKALQL